MYAGRWPGDSVLRDDDARVRIVRRNQYIEADL
jgi:hypothetical protein